MGGRGSSSGYGQQTQAPQVFQMQQQPPQIVATAQQAQAANSSVFSATDNAPFHDLYGGQAYFQKQNLTIDQTLATIQYLRADKEAGTNYSMSQNMNFLMMQNAAQGKPLTAGMNANQLYTYRHMMASMHNLGYNVNLTRYDHGDFVNGLLAKAGVTKDFTKLSASQLSRVLTGKTYGEERMVSTSYNNFKNAPQSSKDTFMNRAVRIEYKAKASTQAMMPGNGPGGRIAEVVMAPSAGRQNYKVVGVRYDNAVNVRQKGTNYLSSQKQLVLTVEVD